MELQNIIMASGPIFSVLFWTLLLALTGLLTYVIWREIQYRFIGIIHQVDGNSNTVIKQWQVKIRKSTKKGRMHIKKFKEWIDIPENKYWKSHNKTQAIYLQWDGRRLFSPVDMQYNETISLSPAYYDAVEDLAKRAEEAPQRHGLLTHWDKYGIYYMVFFIVIAHLFALMMLTDSAPDLQAAGQQALNGFVGGGLLKWAMKQQ